MAEHLSAEQIEAYRRQTMTPAQVLVLDRHMSTCEDCRRKLREARLPDIPFRNLQSSLQAHPPSPNEAREHLSYETLEAYVKNRAGELDREIVESHAELCSSCARELQELNEFAVLMNESPVQATKAKRPSAYRRLLAALGLSNPLRLVGAFAALVLIASVSAVVFFNFNQSRPNLSQAVPSPPQQKSQPATDAAGATYDSASKAPAAPPPPPAFESPPTSRNQQAESLEPARKAAGVIAFSLSVLSRGEAPTLTLTPDANFVDLRAKVPPGANYRARLEKRTGGSQNLGTRNATDAGLLIYRVPVSQLSQGAYALRIYKDPLTDGSVIEYAFEVKR